MEGNDFVLKRGSGKNLPVALTLEHVSPVTRLLEKRKQMLEVQKALDAQKDEYLRKEELFKRREENLRKKDLELQEALVLFNKFLKENEHKRRRADHRAFEEHKKAQRWKKDIENKNKSLNELRQKCAQKQRRQIRNEKYQKFMLDVLDANVSHFDEIQSIITRHTTLEDAYIDLCNKQETATIMNEEWRTKFEQLQKEQSTQTLDLNNKIAAASKELEDSVKASVSIEEKVMQEEKSESLRKRETTQIIMAVDNLYNRCRHPVIKHGMRRLAPKEKEAMDPMMVRKEETCMKLDVIAAYIIDFKDMVESINADMSTATATMRGGVRTGYNTFTVEE